MTPQEIEALRSERDELKAQVEYLKSHFDELIEIAQRCDSWESFPQKPLDMALAALRSLPQQCLRDVQAEAGRWGYIEGRSEEAMLRFGNIDIGDYAETIKNEANKYAAKVRQGGAE